MKNLFNFHCDFAYFVEGKSAKALTLEETKALFIWPPFVLDFTNVSLLCF